MRTTESPCGLPQVPGTAPTLRRLSECGFEPGSETLKTASDHLPESCGCPQVIASLKSGLRAESPSLTDDGELALREPARQAAGRGELCFNRITRERRWSYFESHASGDTGGAGPLGAALFRAPGGIQPGHRRAKGPGVVPPSCSSRARSMHLARVVFGRPLLVIPKAREPDWAPGFQPRVLDSGDPA
jgi:hypothetical protein